MQPPSGWLPKVRFSERLCTSPRQAGPLSSPKYPSEERNGGHLDFGRTSYTTLLYWKLLEAKLSEAKVSSSYSRLIKEPGQMLQSCDLPCLVCMHSTSHSNTWHHSLGARKQGARPRREIPPSLSPEFHKNLSKARIWHLATCCHKLALLSCTCMIDRCRCSSFHGQHKHSN